MARNLVKTSSQHLEYAGTVRGSLPLSFSLWFRLATNGFRQCICAEGHSSTAVVALIQVEASNLLLAYIEGAGGATAPGGSAVIGTGQWYHLGVAYADGDQRVYVDGAIDITGSGTPSPSGMDRLNVGTRTYAGTTQDYLDGDVAEFAEWSVALTAADFASLARAASPQSVRPDALVAYSPLMGRASPEPDVVGDFPLTLVNTPVYADHTRVYRASGPLQLGVPAAAAGWPVTHRLLASPLAGSTWRLGP